ncbi:MAG TPA: DinB family protein [Pseudonocardiaceae bacterium]
MKRVPVTGTEKKMLQVSLDRHRDVVVWKIEGLDDEQVRRQLVPSGTSMLGVVKHLAAVEYGWFGLQFEREHEPLPFDEDDEDADFRVGAGETTEEVLAFYERARTFADKTIDELDVDATGAGWADRELSLRWVLIHMIEETARHAGHMDILRELVDGTAGYHPGD